MKYAGYRITVLLAFIWTVLLPFFWAYHLSSELQLRHYLTFLAYRAELFTTLPCAVLLSAAWRLKRWAIPGFYLGALGLPLLKALLGGIPTDAWLVGAFLFVCLALRLWFLLKPRDLDKLAKS